MIGFGEAGAAFACGLCARVYDRKTDDPATRAQKLSDFADAGVAACDSVGEALDGAAAILSLVTADQALAAAEAAAPLIATGAFWFDLNSVAPDTKRAAAAVIERSGGHFVDVAVMSPVYPARLDVPLLASGPHASLGMEMLGRFGFTNVSVVTGPVGAASSIKMIRSVMIKGLEALTAECFLAADAAGVTDAVCASLEASWPGADWATRVDYNLDRMMVHGLRRAAEMREARKTLDALGTGSAMTRGTVERQRAIGKLGLTPVAGLAAKIDAIRGHRRKEAA